MSSDLLAEFDSFYTAPTSKQTNGNITSAANDLAFLSDTNVVPGAGGGTQWQTQSSTAVSSADIWGNIGSFQPNKSTQAKPYVQEDIWASFEAPVSQSKVPVQAATPNPVNNGSIRAGIIRRPTIDIFSNYNDDRKKPAVIPKPVSQYVPQPQTAPKPKPIRQSSSGGDILFDATDELDGEDEDDFGDFETVASSAPAPPLAPQTLFDFFDNPSPIKEKFPKRLKALSPPTSNLATNLPYPQAPKSPSFQERNPFANLELATAQSSKIKDEEKPASASPATAWPTFEPTVRKELYVDSPVIPEEPEDEWGEFEDLAPETPAIGIVKPTSGIQENAWAWNNTDRVNEVAPPVQSVPPPTNLPPPSVILSLFLVLFDLPQTSLFKGMANQPFSLKNRIISDPATIDFLRAYLLIAIVAARIIAGRKLRWKRDTILSQSMKIGPSAAGGKGGMKLTAVDKTQLTKEDREAAEVIRLWREQLGRLKSAVAIANTSIKEVYNHLTIPELSETMTVKTKEGAMTAPKPCVICGLKREERIAKVDLQVEDSFGEWWIEYWGHRACRNFWQEHESKLKHQ